MSGVASRALALVGLLVGLGAAALLATRAEDAGLGALLGGGLALLFGLAFLATRSAWLLAATGAAGALALAPVVPTPIAFEDGALLALGALGLLTFVEFADLSRREATDPADVPSEAVSARRTQLALVLLLTALLLTLVVALPGLAAPLLSPSIGASAELRSGWGIGALGVLVGMTVLGIARLLRHRDRRAWRDRQS